ncbi:MAG: hypothetical protein ACYDBQ_06600 [Thermoplasmatota archaeon]
MLSCLLESVDTLAHVQCYTCGGAGIISTLEADADSSRASWPLLDCLFTPGCPGATVPEALN